MSWRWSPRRQDPRAPRPAPSPRGITTKGRAGQVPVRQPSAPGSRLGPGGGGWRGGQEPPATRRSATTVVPGGGSPMPAGTGGPRRGGGWWGLTWAGR